MERLTPFVVVVGGGGSGDGIVKGVTGHVMIRVNMSGTILVGMVAASISRSTFEPMIYLRRPLSQSSLTNR